MDTFFLPKETLPLSDTVLQEKLSDYNTLILSIQNTSQWPSKRYGITPGEIKFIQNLRFNGNLVLVVFGNPYLLNEFSSDELNRFDAIVVAYDDEDVTKELAAQGIFGANALSGTLPVSCGPDFVPGDGDRQPCNPKTFLWFSRGERASIPGYL